MRDYKWNPLSNLKCMAHEFGVQALKHGPGARVKVNQDPFDYCRPPSNN